MSGISEWSDILNLAEKIQSLVAEEDWTAIPELSDELESCFHNFFENQISDLSLDEKVSVKEQGAELVALITQVQRQLVLAKQEASQQAGRMAQGRRGVSAYKKA